MTRPGRASAATRSRPRSLAAVALVLLAVALVPLPAAADGGTEQAVLAATARSRGEHGLAGLSTSGDLTAVARHHSQRMADRGELHHNPALGSEVTGWRKVGENVGRGGDVDAIQAAFLASPSHRANILDTDWSQIGVGVVRQGDTLWVTVLFRLPEAPTVAEPEPSTPAPDPEPDPQPDPQPEAQLDQVTEPDPDPVPEPDPQHAPGPGDDEPAADRAPSSPSAGDHAGPDRHEVTSRPLAQDRVTVTLARIEAAERSRSATAMLAR